VTSNEELRRLPDQIAAEHAELARTDAAYLLGGLDQAEQGRFERHLLSCPICQDAVADLSALPGLLGTVSANDLDDPGPQPDTLLPTLLARVGAERRRRFRWTVVTGFAAACLLVLLVGFGVHSWTDSRQPRPLAMSAVGPNSGDIHATVTLSGPSSAPRIELDCGYLSGNGYPGWTEPSYRMVAYNKLGQARDLGSWTPQAGEDVRLWRDSPWPRQALTRIAIDDQSGATVLELKL
jgi:hypothetical protein